MKVTVDSKKGLKTYLKVFVDKKTVEERIGSRLIELSKTINLKGFRPGKVPPSVLKSQFGKAIYGEVLEKILQETSSKALEEKKIKVAGQPKLDLKSYGEGKDLNYTLEIDELPNIKLQFSIESFWNSKDKIINKISNLSINSIFKKLKKDKISDINIENNFWKSFIKILDDNNNCKIVLGVNSDKSVEKLRKIILNFNNILK